MQIDDFRSLEYLNSGSELQQKAYRVLRKYRVMELLEDYDPVLIGTFPLDIQVEGSDLDIALYVQDLEKFKKEMQMTFGNQPSYKFARKRIREIDSGIVNFILEDLELELFAQGIPVELQAGYRHMLLEQALLQARGEEFRASIIRLKQEGLKTEPAFAQLLNLTGDPYESLLAYTFNTMGIIKPEIREVNITRYIQPFREGGSLPGLVDADDGFSYVIKFRGAGQGKKALVAEFIGGELARFLGLRVPEMVFACLDEGFGRTEPDEEIQDLLKFSVGKNLGVSFLNGAITFDANADQISEEEASKIVWLDALLMNVDRTAKNTNMLIWHKELWLIDHGAALYFHHTWDNWQEQLAKPFIQIKDHVLLRYASQVPQIDETYKGLFTAENIRPILDAIPDEWLQEEHRELSANEVREVYVSFLTQRVAQSEVFVNQIQHAR